MRRRLAGVRKEIHIHPRMVSAASGDRVRSLLSLRRREGEQLRVEVLPSRDVGSQQAAHAVSACGFAPPNRPTTNSKAGASMCTRWGELRRGWSESGSRANATSGFLDRTLTHTFRQIVILASVLAATSTSGFDVAWAFNVTWAGGQRAISVDSSAVCTLLVRPSSPFAPLPSEWTLIYTGSSSVEAPVEFPLQFANQRCPRPIEHRHDGVGWEIRQPTVGEF